MVVPLAASAYGQDSLGLADALSLARERNGTVRAALHNVRSANYRVTQARSAFLPTLTPLWRYDDTSQTGPGIPGALRFQGARSEISANWRVLDAGQRDWALAGSRASAQAEELAALQTVRQVLFTVHQQFYEALRAGELLRVSSAQVERAKQILAQTEAQVKVGDAPEKDVFQARADYLNATVQELTSRNRTSTSQASLKATIGWESAKPLPELEARPQPSNFAEIEPLEAALEQGLAHRPDLEAQRARVEAQRAGARRADREAGPTWSLDASYGAGITPDRADNRVVTFLVSMPLFDGGRSRAAAREADASLASTRSSLSQSERDAIAEIESAHAELLLDIQRLDAAQAAVDAARLNYQAAIEAQKAGAAGTTVVTVSTAQVSLVTAESNHVEALYAYFIAEVGLRVATGQALQGEEIGR